MPKLFSSKNSQISVLITLMVFVFLGACYFFIYVPNNEKIVQERYFRCLQNVENNIHSKIYNSLLQVQGLFDADTTAQKAILNNYVQNYPKDNFTLARVDTVYPKGKLNTFGKDASSINVDPSLDRFTLFVNKPITNRKTGDTLYLRRMGIRYKFEQFIRPLLPTEVFENYIVFYGKTAVFETFPSGLSFTKKDSLLQLKSGIISPGFRSMNISGKDYKVFSQPVNMDANDVLVIIGLVSDKNYQKEKNQLPVWAVLLLLTVAIGIIISLPWIKLYHMGNKDKLTVTDGIASVLISMLLMSLLFFIIFQYSFEFSPSYKHFYNSRDTLPSQITKAFEKDLDTANLLLTRFNKVHNNFKNNVVNLGKRNALYEVSQNVLKYVPIEKNQNVLKNIGAQNIDVHQVYWLDTNGVEKDNWITDSINAPHTDLSSRAYFNNTMKNKANRVGTDQFIDQVVSRVSGAFTTVIAKGSKNNYARVAAMSFTAKSLDSVIMPNGYLFAIIDSTGQVLYHSIAGRNLNENLLMEFADSSHLVSALQAKSDTSFKAEYYGRNYIIKLKPLQDLPYFVVVFEDLEYNDARDTESYSFTLSMLICLLLFLVIQVSIVFFASSKRSFFKKQLFETSWICPKTSSHRQYNLAIIANLAIMVMLAFYFELGSFLKYLYILLISITSVSIFLNVIFAARYKREGKPDYLAYKVVAIGWLCGFAAVINIAAFCTLELKNFISLFIFEVLLTAVCFIIYKRGELLLEKAQKYRSRFPDLKFYWTYTQSFALMTTTRLIITSGIPVAFFFIYSFNYEQNLDTRFRQLNFAESLTQKVRSRDLVDPQTNKLKKDIHSLPGVYYDGASIQKIGIVGKKQNTIYSREDSITAKILNAFRLFNNDLELRSNNMDGPSTGYRASFNNITHVQSSDSYTTITDYKIGNGKYIRLSSGHMDYPPLLIRFWILLVISLVVFYYIIHNIIRKLFALNLPATNGWEIMDEKLLVDNKLNSLLFVLGSPGSGKLNKIKKKLKNNKYSEAHEKELTKLIENNEPDLLKEKIAEFNAGKLLGNKGELIVYNDKDPSNNNVFIADMILIPSDLEQDDPDWEKCKEEALKDNYALVIINHFEYNIKDANANKIKLGFLESIMQKGASKIMIISTVHPLTFLDSFNEQQKGMAAAQAQNTGIPESELERWHVLLGHFRIVIEPLNDLSKMDNHKQGFKFDPMPLQRAIFEETKYSHYLNNMHQMAINTATSIRTEDIDDISDSVIFKLQITSHYFYTYIWQSLTKEEKFLLYDLAEDGLVNPYDDYNLSMLICKGLIIKPDGTLMLFNKGFRNFILTAIGNTEVNRIKDQVKDNGSWGSLKTPLIIIILAILVFLIASQQEAYTRIITYVTALGAGVPAVLKVFSLFQGNSQKPQ